ncbi:hypothetical protein CDL40_05525 [Escherichia coli]|nr:hypothetical protein CE141_27825 [Escherichia coli]OXK37847.1 hypothetical protein CDL40_05525 [Escherichia coli]
MASVSISCPSCSATDGVVRNGKSTTFLSHCAECDFARYYFTLPIHLGSNAICEVTINSRKFTIWTTNNGWCSVIQIFTKRDMKWHLA